MARIAIDVDEVLVNFLYPMASSRRLQNPKKPNIITCIAKFSNN